MEELLIKIEELRALMIQTAEAKSLHDPEVCRISQRLDNYINDYLKLAQPLY
ncbi:Spo0E family sporulation regulatory protein-aspartic acid phosphatase [Aneurinibacillus sp. REN35]|uniref:Spo0E family sporulation regulatory protein-aspartic acid phosphatase n=1 Tax=Aneurinibacillus sp. REN35 TaxID=3237286 RepID=UPI003528E519